MECSNTSEINCKVYKFGAQISYQRVGWQEFVWILSYREGGREGRGRDIGKEEREKGEERERGREERE